MDRFDDMRAKATASGGGGGVNVDGTEVSIIAQTSLSTGDRFEGIATGELPICSDNGLGISNIKTDTLGFGVSDDRSVLMTGGYIYSQTEYISFYLKNAEGNYELIQAPIEGNLKEMMESVSLGSIDTSGGNHSVNEDGTLIYIEGNVFNSGTATRAPFVIMVEIDKENRSGRAYAIQNPFATLEEKIRTEGVRLRGNWLVAYESNYVDTTRHGLSVYKYSNHSFDRIYHYNYTSSKPKACQIVGDYLIVYESTTGNLWKIDKNTAAHLGFNTMWRPMGQASYSVLTHKGLLAISNGTKSNVYDVNFDGLSYTTVISVTITSGTMIYPDEQGGYVLTSKGIYDLTTKELINSAITSNNKNVYSTFDSKLGVIIGTKIHKVIPATAGEYSAIRCEGADYTTENGKVYGVALEDIRAGEVGAGKIMFLGQPVVEETT